MTIRPVPGLTLEQQPEEVLFRMCLWAEARGEPLDGMLGVAHVILNRTKGGKKSVRGVILAPYQFSWTMDSDPNRTKAFEAWKADPSGWQRADVVAWLVEHGLTVDPTHGSRNYYNPTTAQPAWGRGHPKWVEKAALGHHIFGDAT